MYASIELVYISFKYQTRFKVKHLNYKNFDKFHNNRVLQYVSTVQNKSIQEGVNVQCRTEKKIKLPTAFLIEEVKSGFNRNKFKSAVDSELYI